MSCHTIIIYQLFTINQPSKTIIKIIGVIKTTDFVMICPAKAVIFYQNSFYRIIVYAATDKNT